MLSTLLKRFLQRRPSFPTYAITKFAFESALWALLHRVLHGCVFKLGVLISLKHPQNIFSCSTYTLALIWLQTCSYQNKGMEKVETDLSWNCKCEQQETGAIQKTLFIGNAGWVLALTHSVCNLKLFSINYIHSSLSVNSQSDNEKLISSGWI